ncbi:MAG: phosphotransferase [Woeseia sp.]
MPSAAAEAAADSKATQSGRASKSARSKKRRALARELTGKCSELLGESIESLEYPGGRSRRSIRLVLKNGNTAIASVRPQRSRAATECSVLEELPVRGAPVPRLLASDGRNTLIQEDLGGIRLAQAMHGAEELQVERLLDNALTGLSQAQRAGSAAGFDERFETLGDRRDWLVGFLDRPAVIGRILDTPAPPPALQELEKLLAVRKPRFVKWDARPGNAMVRENGRVFWIDWEHCGTRNRLDDMAWVLGDEHVPDCPLVEERLIKKHIARFADDLSVEAAMQYLFAYGVFHMTVRLGLIGKYRMTKGEWWDHDYCVERDKVGVTLTCLERICTRAARWAQRNPHTEPLAPWFGEIFTRLDQYKNEPTSSTS